MYDDIIFSEAVEESLRKGDALLHLYDKYSRRLQELTGRVTSHSLEQLKVTSSILDVIRNRDILSFLMDNHVCDVMGWSWQAQMRYCNNSKEKLCTIKMGDAVFDYSYEYQGNQQKLVHTLLTDKCFLNLTQAMRFGFGGNPFGPAGTGKTETVKALGAAFGRQVLVFNCDEGLDFASMGRIFMGLVMLGSWGCFDEFNRLKEDQLSAIAGQIAIIQQSIKQKLATINLLGYSIAVNHRVGIFITMNPASKDYGGRSTLPGNLKALFRPVAMGFPDYAKIAEVTLLSGGFTRAKALGSKAILLFSSLKHVLSRQKHYDWSLRTIQLVLKTACRLRQLQCSNTSTLELQEVCYYLSARF